MELPSSARLRMFRLQAAASDVAGQADATTKRIRHLEEALGYAENSDADVANIEHELARLRGVLAQQQAKSIARSQVVAALNTFLNGIPANVRVSVPDAVSPQLMSGETCRTAIERLRMEITKLSTAVRRLRYAVMMQEEQRMRAAQWVAGLAASVNAHIEATHVGGFKVSIEHTAATPGSAALAYMAWVNPDALTQRLHQMIDSAPNQLAMPRREQEKRLAEAAAELLQAERHEEYFIEKAGDEGLEIERRATADPQALLGIAVVRHAAVIRR